MTAQEESHETKQGQDEDRHEPRFLVSPALKSSRYQRTDYWQATVYQEGLVTLAQLRQRMPALQKQTQAGAGLADRNSKRRLKSKICIHVGARFGHPNQPDIVK
jgi:hypothetical protein